MTELIPIDSCSHRTLTRRDGQASYETVVECLDCGKKVAFPLKTLVYASQDDWDSLILMTFGPLAGSVDMFFITQGMR